MKKSKVKILMCLASLFCLMSFKGKISYAADEEYITITIDAEDDNDSLMYSIDTTEPSAFTNSNTFTIPANTTHTIYVKDEAGNITSQEYTPPEPEQSSDNIDNTLKEPDSQLSNNTLDKPDNQLSDNTIEDNKYTNADEYNTDVEDVEMQDINIELEVGEDGRIDNINYSGILGTGNGHSTELLTEETGVATAHDKVTTDGTDTGEKVFYTVTTAEGDTFYMVVDQRQNNDNVYLLNAVTRSDLAALAVDDSEEGNINDVNTNKKEDSLLDALQNEKNIVSSDSSNTNKEAASGESEGISPQIIIVLAVIIGGGVYYYLKVYKNKKNEQMDVMDAMDMNEFTTESDEEEAEFEVADEEKKEYLNNIINADENNKEAALYDADPEEYAASYITSKEKDESIQKTEAASEEKDEPIQKTEAASEENETNYNSELENAATNEEKGLISEFADFEADYDPELDGEEE